MSVNTGAQGSAACIPACRSDGSWFRFRIEAGLKKKNKKSEILFQETYPLIHLSESSV